jgi:hypothetical protein
MRNYDRDDDYVALQSRRNLVLDVIALAVLRVLGQ